MKNLKCKLLNFRVLSLFVLFLLLFENSNAQKFIGKNWVNAGISSLDDDKTGYINKVSEMFQGSKLYFDKENLKISFENGKNYTFGYEWKADTKVLLLNFTGKDLKDAHINFLYYYSYLCKQEDDSEFLALSFLVPEKSGIINPKAKPKFSLSYRKK